MGLVGLLVVSCYTPPELLTDSGRIAVRMPGVEWPMTRRPYVGVPVAAGSSLCPELVGHLDGPPSRDTFHEADLSDCYEISADGPVTWDGACAQLEGAGWVRFTMTPRVCEQRERADIPNQVETLSLEIVEPSSLRGRIRPAVDAFWEVYLQPAPEATFPDDASPSPDDPVLIAESGMSWFLAEVDDTAGRSTAWSNGVLTGIPDHVLASGTDRDFMVRAGPGVTFVPVLELPGRDVPLGELRSVPVDAAEHLEIVSAHGYEVGVRVDDDTTDWVEWVQLRAWVRDGQGRPIYGMPVEWSVIEGHVALETRGSRDTDDWLLTDYAQVADICFEPRVEEPPGRAVVEARLGSLRHTITVDFESSREHPTNPWPGDEWLAMCQGPDGPVDRGCACVTTPGARPPLLGGLALVLLGVTRRRTAVRHSRSGPASSPLSGNPHRLAVRRRAPRRLGP